MSKSWVRLPITGGATAISVEDIGIYSSRNWHKNDSGYAVWRGVDDGRKKTVRMHRLIAKTPKGEITDHINGDTLDNRRENLRVVSQKENCRNQKGHRNGDFKGYWCHSQNGNWCVNVYNVKIGVFDSEELANQVAYSIYEGDLPLEKMKPVEYICKNGHDKRVVGEYTYSYGNNCKKCQSDRSREYYKRKRGLV